MRSLLRSHLGYVVFAVTTLALAVGAALVVFTLTNALWLKPPPFANADRLVMLLAEGASGSNEGATFGGVEDLAAWSAFDAVAGQVATSGQSAGLRPRVAVSGAGDQTETLGVTSRYFALLGLTIRGRDFTRDDNRYGAEPVAIISDRLWSQAFGRDEAVLGSVVAAIPVPLRIIGVAPSGFAGARRGERTDVWIPANLVPRVAPTGDVAEDTIPTLVLARLRPGQTMADAKRRLVDDARSERDRRARDRIVLVPLARVFGSPATRSVILAGDRTAGLVAGMTALVLVAGCTTLMALVLVHYERRKRELAIRLALGASRAALVGSMARELAVLAAAGIVVAVVGSQLVLAAAPSLSLPGGVVLDRLDVTLDWRILVAAIVMTGLTLLAAALLPVSRFTRTSLVTDLVGAHSTVMASSHRLRQWLLGLHVAATMVVLVSAGLFVRAVSLGFDVGAGFDVDRTVFLQAQLAPPFGLADGELQAAVMESRRRRLEEGLRLLPGVEVVATGRSPIGPSQTRLLLTPRRLEVRGEPRTLHIGGMPGSPELLTALGVPLLRGRHLTSADATTRPQPILVTASLARVLWRADDPLGQPLTQIIGERRTTSIVVGVTTDFAFGSLMQDSAGVIITVPPPIAGLEPGFVLRTTQPDVVTAAARRLVNEIVPDAPRIFLATGRQVLRDDLGPQRLGAWFFSGFGLASLVLGLGGIFGLVAYLAESRRREFGLRLALGSTPLALVTRGVAAGLTPVVFGSGAGLLIAGLVTRILRSWLPGLSEFDPVVYVVVLSLTAAGATIAASAAAWRLRLTTPSEALRAE